MDPRREGQGQWLVIGLGALAVSLGARLQNATDGLLATVASKDPIGMPRTRLIRSVQVTRN